ncbi:MAG: nucleotide exchange factor GrpE [Ignavibacteria bacterium]
MTKSRKEKSEMESSKNDLKEIEIPITQPDESGEPLETTAESADNSVELKAQIEDLRDQYLRKVAEFENYKRRTDSERSDFFAYASERLISELLPVLDDFGRIMKAYDEKHDAESFKKGVELVYEKFRKTLEKQGLKEMKSDGSMFDVNLHEALLQQPDEKAAPETILNTVEKGYYLRDKVLRHAKVIVSTKLEKE